MMNERTFEKIVASAVRVAMKANDSGRAFDYFAAGLEECKAKTGLQKQLCEARVNLADAIYRRAGDVVMLSDRRHER